MKRRADLQRRVVALLGEVFAGEIVTQDDLDTIDGHIDGKVAELSRRRVIYIADADQIDDEVFEPLARLVAVEAATGQYHHVPPQFTAPLADATRMRAENMLREMQLEPHANETVRAAYF